MKNWIALLGALLLCSQAHGWGVTGHRVSAEIAERYLTPKTRHGVTAILGRETLAQASTWPDFMRADPDEFWQVTANPWHYVTVPPGKQYNEVGAPPQGDAMSALKKFSAQIHDPDSTLYEKQLALRFVIHIVGDLHQPLHVGHGGDRGGNDFKITWFGQPSNLHRLWDSQMIDHKQLSYSEMKRWLQTEITADLYREWGNPDPMVWVAESAGLRDRIYPETPEQVPGETEAPIPALGWDYVYRWNDDLERRLKQAGVRTAVYLNALFDI
ncbi:MAG: S1/P1 nuclease [Wenzhouxiangellaceae bacterium]